MKRPFTELLRRRAAPTPGDDALERARAIDHWRALAPDLNITGAGPARPQPGERDPELDAEALVRGIAGDGFVRTAPLVPEARLERARRAAYAVERAGWPWVFAYVYDEVWAALRAPALCRALSALLGEGHRQLPGLWLHAVPDARGARGWGPHVDVAGPPRFCRDGRPERLTAWVPLVDTGPENAGLYAIPAHEVPADLVARFDALEALDMDLALRLLHAARPLPAAAGALVAWRLDVIHWGGVHPGEGAGPRLSLSLEYLHEAAPLGPADELAFDARGLPSFEARLWLIGRALLAYGKAKDREPFAHRFLALGEALYR